MDRILEWLGFVLGFAFFIAIISLLRRLHWIWRGAIGTVIFTMTAYMVAVYADGFYYQMKYILVGALIYSMLFAPDTSEVEDRFADYVTDRLFDSVRDETDAKIDALRDELEAVKYDMDGMDWKHSSESEEDTDMEEDECETRRAEVAALRAELEQLKKNDSAAELWSHEAELKSLRHELEELRAHLPM